MRSSCFLLDSDSRVRKFRTPNSDPVPKIRIRRRFVEALYRNICRGVERSLSFEGNSDFGPYLFYLDLVRSNFVAAHLTSVQLILQLKFCSNTTVHLLLEELKNLSQVILQYTIIYLFIYYIIVHKV